MSLNKIPELTQDQISSLVADIEFADPYLGHVDDIREIYLSCLKIADQQGLLTKEASLTLKPDNYIEWEYEGQTGNYHGTTKHYTEWNLNTSNKEALRFGLIYDVHNNENMLDIYICNDNYFAKEEGGNILLHVKNYSQGLEQAKQFCQNWLDEKLKG